jgi:hypothetical protein
MAEKKNSRQKLLERVRAKYPDRTFADLGVEQEGAADLDDAIDEMLEEYSTRQATYDENDNKLKSLLGTDPDIAEVIQSWVETGDPRVAIVDKFGDELGMSDEAKEKFKTNLAGWKERRAQNDALSAEAESNWENSLNALEEWGNAKNLSLEQKRDVMLRLLAVTFNGIVNKYGPEDFDMALRSMNYDTDVAAARAAGEVAGRNAKISAERRVRSEANTMPPSVGNQGGRAAEKKPTTKNNSPWAGVK